MPDLPVPIPRRLPKPWEVTREIPPEVIERAARRAREWWERWRRQRQEQADPAPTEPPLEQPQLEQPPPQYFEPWEGHFHGWEHDPLVEEVCIDSLLQRGFGRHRRRHYKWRR